jgi:chorismate synthase
MNTFGRLFRVSVFGESHGKAVGIMIDGCPPGIEVSEEEILLALDRRRAGSRGTSPRKEHDIPAIFSGIYQGRTTGAPILISTENTNKISSDYDKLKSTPRPGHADFTSRIKFRGMSDPRGGGHFSGRLTWGIVVAGVIAKKILGNISISANIQEVGGSTDIETAVERALAEDDSIGGLIRCSIKGLPAGMGEPFFMSVESHISSVIFSIPAIKGIDFGSGFASASMKGSEHNDSILDSNGATATNNAGGINGGISNGNEIYFRVAVKPTSSISKPQETINLEENKMVELSIKGRHDACIALRMPVIIESAAAIALADLMLFDRGIFGERKNND